MLSPLRGLALLVAFFGAVVSASGIGQEIRQMGLNTTASAFDFYVMAYSWQPQFCAGTTYPGCKTPDTWWKTHFTLHGLWPQYTTGYPSYCTTEAYDNNGWPSKNMDTMLQYWPNVKVATTDPTYSSFWSYEWGKHGVCTNLAQSTYFPDAINLIEALGTPSIVSSNVGGSVSASSLRSAFGGSTYVSLQCTSGSKLNGAYTCWSKASDNQPSARIACSADVISEDTCSSSTITIASF